MLSYFVISQLAKPILGKRDDRSSMTVRANKRTNGGIGAMVRLTPEMANAVVHESNMKATNAASQSNIK